MRYKHSAIGPWMRHPKDGGIHTQKSGRLPGPKPWVRRPQEGAKQRLKVYLQTMWPSQTLADVRRTFCTQRPAPTFIAKGIGEKQVRAS